MAHDLSDREAAQQLGKHPRTIQRWCAKGKLAGAYKAGRSWRIPRRAFKRAGLAALFDEPYISELQAATTACEQIQRELSQLKLDAEPAHRRDWKAIARQLEKLETALTGLPKLAAQVPSRLSRPGPSDPTPRGPIATRRPQRAVTRAR